jgi:Fic family protein
LIQEGAGDAGQWKRLDNEIIEPRPGKPPLVRFRAVPASQTPLAIEELCRNYRHALEQEKVPPAVALAALILDFLCIHPFRDGNGRVARLLTLLELYRHGMEVGRYIGLERLVEETKEDYYRGLQESSQGWHDNRHDLLPWLNYFLAIIRRAYREFQQRAAQMKSPHGAKTEMIRKIVLEQPAIFSLGAILDEAPGVSREMIKRVLQKMAMEHLIKSLGKGRSAAWKKV